MTVGEMPAHNHNAVLESAGSHTHTVPVSNRTGAGGGLIAGPQIGDWDTSAAGEHTHKITISNTGHDTSHNNMPPYIVATFWKRMI